MKKSNDFRQETKCLIRKQKIDVRNAYGSSKGEMTNDIHLGKFVE